MSPGIRTVAFGVCALSFLLVGYSLALSFPSLGAAGFSTYATTVGGIVGAIAVKHGIESLATGTGIVGAKNALMTATQPPEVKP